MIYRDDGVPILKDVEIEDMADLFLSYFDCECLIEPKAISPVDLLDYANNKLGITIAFQNFENLVQDGSRVLACTRLDRNTIIFDEGMAVDEKQKPIFNFVVAHELGHWKLHRNLRIKGISNKVVDTERSVGLKSPLATPRDWLEHHANVFARELLMPKWVFKQGLIKAQEDIGVSKNRGEVYKKEDVGEVVGALQKIFGTSKTSLEIRLIETGLFDPNKNKEQVF